MNFYVFNLINGQDVVENGVTPQFEQVGPFVYKEKRLKQDIVDNMNYTISYKEKRLFEFVPELSVADDTFNITSINLAAITAINFAQNFPDILHPLINLALKLTGETILIKQPVGKLLFGYNDTFLSILSKLSKNLVPDGHLSFFYNKNDTIDGEYTIFTGVDDINKLGLLERFNGMK